MITTTDEHPFWVVGWGWLEAEDLEVGMLLQTSEETFVDLDRIEHREGTFTVYNLEVEEFHTYFVSDLGILVHNACDLNWNSKSKPTFGHTFEKHGQGSKNTKNLQGTAGGTIQPQGQWLDNQKAADFLKDLRTKIGDKPTTVEIPDGLGQVILPDGKIVPANKAIVVPIPNKGYKTAYPIIN